MALSRFSLHRRWLPGGPAKPLGLLPVVLAASLLAGCGGDAPDAPAATAVAGESVASVSRKPLAIAVEAGVAMPVSLDAVPTLPGKVRYGTPLATTTGAGESLEGAVPFPPTDAWNRDVLARPADAASAVLVASIDAGTALKAGFGALAGVPYAIVDGTQPRVTVTVAGDATARWWPIPASMAPSVDSSARMSVVDRDAGVLYELYGAARTADGGWAAAAVAAWRLDLADAAPFDTAGAIVDGLPVFAGLVRRDEAAAGVIRHALRITVPALRAAWVAPARGVAAGVDDASLPPVGARLRLRAEVEIPADAGIEARAILQALKTYGAIVVGVGPALTLEGAPDAGWDAARIDADLSRIRAVDFEVVALDVIRTP